MKCNRTGPNSALRAGGVETGYYPGQPPTGNYPRATTHELVLKKNGKKIEKKGVSQQGASFEKGIHFDKSMVRQKEKRVTFYNAIMMS